MKKCPKCPEVYSDMMHFCPNDGNPLTPIVSQDPFVNTVLDGKYLIEEPIGKGGMGLVYRARHVNFNRLFAIKILKNELVSDPQAIKRFRNEANAAGMIRHPNAITITDFNITNDGSAYLVMDYVEGRSLRDILKKEGKQSYTRTVSLLSQVCDAAAAAHRKGIIHRDLKPDNIMVEQQEDQSEMVRVLDFGIAKLSQNPAYSENITVGGAILGSPYYMSPEQCDGRHLDSRSDIYSLGIILYELLVGKVPFRAQTPWGLVKMHCSAPPPPIRNHRPDIAPALEAAILKALSKDPKDRQQSAIDLKRELEAALNTSNQVISPAPQPHSISPATIEMDIQNVSKELAAKQNFGAPPYQKPDLIGTKPLPNSDSLQVDEKESLEKQKLEALAKELEAEISQIRARKDVSGGLKSPTLRNTPSEALSDLANDLANELNLFDPKKATSSNISSQYANGGSSRTPIASPNTPIPSTYTTNPHYQVSPNPTPATPYAVPATAPHGSVSGVFMGNRTSQKLASTFEPIDIAEEFSLALPEMVEDVLMSVSESIVTKAEVLSQRIAQETTEAAKSVIADAQARMQIPKGISPTNFNSPTSNFTDSGRSVIRQIPGLVQQETKSTSEFKKQLVYIIGGTLLIIVVIWLITSMFK
ncbi:MAG: protein kinase [Acidobacteria bacterium]|nr:protein kinase [Acidobacteriota bacterium]